MAKKKYKRVADDLMKKNDSYIDCLSIAIDEWKNASNMKDKTLYMLVIGYIGTIVNKQNKDLEIDKLEY